MLRSSPEAPCPHCGGPTRPQPVYKHRWGCCARCGCAARVAGAPAFAARLPAGLVARLPGQLGPARPGQDFYLAGAGTAAAAQADRREADQVEAMLRALDLDATGRVLDVGGGRGAVVARLAPRAARAVLTERSEALLALARAAGLEAAHLDFEDETPGEGIKGHFDLILIRYTLGWCRDLPRLLARLGALAASGARLLISVVTVSRAAALCSALEDAAPWVLWSAACLAERVEAAGWRLQRSFEAAPPMPFWRPHRRGFAALSLPWALAPGPLRLGLRQRHAGLLFERVTR